MPIMPLHMRFAISRRHFCPMPFYFATLLTEQLTAADAQRDAARLMLPFRAAIRRYAL